MPASVELCVKALQLPKQDDSETRISVCKMVSCLLQADLEVLRACQLTEFLLGPGQEVFGCLEELYLRPDQKYDQENEVIPNSLRCELLLALKAYWPFDPEFWDWNTLKYHCTSLLGLVPESEGDEEEAEEAAVVKQEPAKPLEPHGISVRVESEHQERINGSFDGQEQQNKKQSHCTVESPGESETRKHKLCCQICKRSLTESQVIHHSKRHAGGHCHPCPLCSEKFKNRKELVSHIKQHIEGETSLASTNVKTEEKQNPMEEDDDIEPGEITIDPSLMLYYKSTRDPDVLHHIVQQAKTVKKKHLDEDEHITFEYIDQHFKLQNRDEYQCPGTGCTRVFKHSKYLYVHLKSEHIGDENVKHFHQMKDKREKCVFCRRHFISAYHHRKHRRVHYGDRPYTCVVIGCGAQFKTSNELVTHKQTHGYQLNYQCELKGCYVTYSDLGQIYHHEAQHFRDAAFTCSSAECRKYYLSKKEFIKHLSTHNITFSEEDFESQRKEKRKLLRAVPETAAPVNRSPLHGEKIVNKDVANSSSVSCASPVEESESKEPKATMTLVAVCFDGSKFTCGFEKCGMTFSRARDVQRHLKCAHPEHLKLENREHKHDKEHGSKYKGVKPEPEADREAHGKTESSASNQPVEYGKDRKVSGQPKNNETNSYSSFAKNDTLKEVLIGLSKLNLNCSSPHGMESDSAPSNQEAAQVFLHQAIMTNPVASLPKSPHPPEEGAPVKVEESAPDENVDLVESLANAKPYTCEMKGCGFRTAQSYSLLRHYHTKHGRTMEQARRLTSLKTTSFKPYMCHLCSKSHREKHVLRAHYIQVHNLSEASLAKMSWTSRRYEGNKDSSKHTSPNSKNHGHNAKEFVPKLQQNEKQDSPPSTESTKTLDNHSPSEEEGEDEAERREEDGQLKEDGEDRATQVRTPRRLVAKSNLCYILDKFSKPFHCVAKNCDAAFSTQAGLVRHLQLVHHYNRSQLLLEKDLDENHSPEVRKEPAKKRPLSSSDEPQPQYQCHFANCNASYHLKSSLARHTRDCHSQPPELLQCKYEDCKREFSHDEALKNQSLYNHYEYCDSLVVRLQSTHKKSVTGCQKKLIVTPQSPQKKEPVPATTTQAESSCPEPEETPEPEEVVKEDVEGGTPEKKTPDKHSKSRRATYSSFVYRSHEEALQMCQDRCLRTAYPCMIQDCDSVVTYTGSLQRHYLRVHKLRREELTKHEDALVFTAEQLEELIQRKSARPTAAEACTPNGVQLMEYQAEPEKEEGSPAPVSLHSVNADSQCEENGDLLPEEEEPPPIERSDMLVDADEVEPSTSEPTEDLPDAAAPDPVATPEPAAAPEPAPAAALEATETPDPVAAPEQAEAPAQEPAATPEPTAKPDPAPAAPPEPATAPDPAPADEPEPAPAPDPEPEPEPTPEPAPANIQKPEERLSLEKLKTLLRPVTVDLSLPCSRISTEEGYQDGLTIRDGGKLFNGSAASPPVRQPLKRKNELSEQPSNLKDSQPCSPSPRPFEVTAYKPTGFESSFLRFIQEKTPKDKNSVPVKRRESFRRSCSVKENNQLGISHTRSRRTHSPLLKSHAKTGDFTSVQNLKSILDKALAGCGDLAIKQLQYLRPVVVLGRPVCATTSTELFPTDNNKSKLVLGS